MPVGILEMGVGIRKVGVGRLELRLDIREVSVGTRKVPIGRPEMPVAMVEMPAGSEEMLVGMQAAGVERPLCRRFAIAVCGLRLPEGFRTAPDRRRRLQVAGTGAGFPKIWEGQRLALPIVGLRESLGSVSRRERARWCGTWVRSGCAWIWRALIGDGKFFSTVSAQANIPF